MSQDKPPTLLGMTLNYLSGTGDGDYLRFLGKLNKRSSDAELLSRSASALATPAAAATAYAAHTYPTSNPPSYSSSPSISSLDIENARRITEERIRREEYLSNLINHNQSHIHSYPDPSINPPTPILGPPVVYSRSRPPGLPPNYPEISEGRSKSLGLSSITIEERHAQQMGGQFNKDLATIRDQQGWDERKIEKSNLPEIHIDVPQARTGSSNIVEPGGASDKPLEVVKTNQLRESVTIRLIDTATRAQKEAMLSQNNETAVHSSPLMGDTKSSRMEMNPSAQKLKGVRM